MTLTVPKKAVLDHINHVADTVPRPHQARAGGERTLALRLRRRRGTGATLKLPPRLGGEPAEPFRLQSIGDGALEKPATDATWRTGAVELQPERRQLLAGRAGQRYDVALCVRAHAVGARAR